MYLKAINSVKIKPHNPAWTPERRARQAEAIKSWSPWAHSTGPRTRRGKARSSRNARKHGLRSTRFIVLRKLIANQARMHAALAKIPANELLKTGLESMLADGVILIGGLLATTFMQKPCILEPPEGKS